VCEEIVRDRRQATALPPAPTLAIVRPTPVQALAAGSTPVAPRGRCPECGCAVLMPNRAHSAAPRCKPCREEHTGGPAASPSPSTHPEVCAGWNGGGCTRPALGSTGLCVRCRTRRLERTAS
jgi:hypothetical protein